ncbi:SpoIIE family protein phosphatase [Candidatus Poribacteria bacterium]|nr:SpoIIE family protein phosphatase [Candidatus Poribacteria bacterium]
MEDTSDSIKLAFDDIERLADEIQLAKELQRSMLPKLPTTLDRFDINATWLPANEMSGDFYDFIPIDSDRWGIVLADVMGKGMPAAMVMASARSALRMVAKSADSSRAVLNILNKQLLGDVAQRTHVSLIYILLDVYHQTLTISNAGIPYPLLLNPDGKCTEIEISGYPLGNAIRGFDYVDKVIDLKPNSALILYSDGIDEARDIGGESYGFSRLPRILENRTDLSAKGLVDLILQDVLSYTGDVRQDDMTIVVIKAKEAISARHRTENRAYQLVPEILRTRLRQEQGKIEGERRVVTLVTVDFSHLSELNGETVRQATDAIAQIIFKHEGLVNRVLVNEISGSFGAPIRHANDAEVALRAASEMRDILRRIAQKGNSTLAQAKITLYTGTVVVSDISEEWVEFSQVDPLFKSIRALSDKTSSGEIWVDENTYKLTHADFDYSLLPSIEESPGRELQPYRFCGQRSKAGRVAPDQIFRRYEPQLRRLQSHASELVGKEKGRIISVVGDAGVGKHRLISEFKEYLGSQVMWVTSRCVPEKRRSSYAVFITLLQRLLNIDTSATATDLRKCLKRSLEQLHDAAAIDWMFSVDEVCSYFMALLVADYQPDDEVAFLSYEQLQLQTFVAIRDVLVTSAHRKPIVLVLDDLHWIDDVSKNLITFLIDDFSNTPILLLCLSHSQNWWLRDRVLKTASAHYDSIFLELLSLEESVLFLESLLPGTGVPESLKTRILHRSNGSPFHITQIAKLLQADGVLVNHNDEWLVMEDMDSIFIPNTLEGVLSARTDRLNINTREIMQYAAVLGAMASLELLRQMANFIPHLDYHLQRLQDFGLIEIMPEEEELRYQLERALIANIVYASIPKQERISHHVWIAQWLEKQESVPIAEHYELLQFHYSRTYEARKSVEYLIKAGHRARRCFNNADAIAFYEQGLDTIRDSNLNLPEQMQEIYEGLGDVFKAIGRYNDALVSYNKRLSLSEEAINSTTLVNISHKIAEVYIRQSRWDDALTTLKAVEEEITGDAVEDGVLYSGIDRSVSASELLGDVYRHMSTVYSQRGALAQAINIAQKSLTIFQASDSPRVWAQAHGVLGSYYTRTGDLQRAETHLRAGVEYAHRIGDRRLLFVFYDDLGMIVRASNQFVKAIEYYEKSIEIKKHLKHFDTLSRTHFGLAQIYQETDDVENALLHFRNALEYSKHGSSDQFIAHLHVELAHIYQQQGRIDLAITHYQKNIELRRDNDDEIGVARGQSFLCEAYFAKGDFVAALDACSTALEAAGMLNINTLEAQNYITLARIHQAKEDWQATVENLQNALSTADKTDDGRLMGQIHRHLAEAYLQSNQPEFARDHLYEALALFEELDAQEEVAEIRQQMEEGGIV